MKVKMKRLPIDVSDFRTMIEGDYLYVDKTKQIYDLITQGRFYFLSRPRRFGKSLLVSTLKEIFLGEKDIFDTLLIGKSNYSWEKHPVIHLDFSSIPHETVQSLETNLVNRLALIGQQYDIILQDRSKPEVALYELVTKLGKKSKVVILVDEYDYPILKHITDLEKAVEIQNVLRNFYTTIKGLDGYLRFVLLTGVTKFSKTSIFSGLNNLNDISLDLMGSTLLGYTEHEVERYFSTYINLFAQEKKRSIKSIMAEMKDWYNGYKFCGNKVAERVYNPFSVLYYLYKQERKNYWFESGTPSFLISLLKKKYHDKALDDFDKVIISDEAISAFDVEKIPLMTLLFQTGYLTIKSYDNQYHMYTLSLPNEEVRISLHKYLLSIASDIDKPKIDLLVFEIKKTLEDSNIALFIAHLSTLFAGIPYHLIVNNEAYWHSLVHIIATLIGFEVLSEVATSKGRADCIMVLKKQIFIFEFKFNGTGQEALEQIQDKKYYEKYLIKHKQITLVGISFNYKDKELMLDWIKKDL